jgi:hypothetical protein
MITAADNSWRYFGLPRTGSTLLHRILQLPPICGLASDQQHDVLPMEYPGKHIISVRHPFSRAVSLWRHLRYQKGLAKYGRLGEDGHIRPLSEEELPFREYLQWRPWLEDFYRLTLMEWLQPIYEARDNRQRTVHHIIRQEFLWEDVQAALPQLRGMPAPEPENRSRAARCAVDPYEDPWCRQQVLEWAQPDCAAFGYSMTVPENLGL